MQNKNITQIICLPLITIAGVSAIIAGIMHINTMQPEQTTQVQHRAMLKKQAIAKDHLAYSDVAMKIYGHQHNCAAPSPKYNELLQKVKERPLWLHYAQHEKGLEINIDNYDTEKCIENFEKKYGKKPDNTEPQPLYRFKK